MFRNMVGLKLCWLLKPPNVLAVFGAHTIVAVLSSDDFFGVAVLVLQAPRGVKPHEAGVVPESAKSFLG